ncbi:MAG: hypothetical protein Fur0022_22520 [Anaerolineales bacterium]
MRRKVGLYGLASILLLYGGVFLAVESLANFVRGLDDVHVWLTQIGVGVVSAGWWAGSRKRKPWLGWGMALVVGGGLVFFQVGNLWFPAFAFLRNLAGYLWLQLTANINWLVFEQQVDLWPAYTALSLSGREFSSLFMGVITPLSQWWQGVFAGEVEYERSAAMVLWSWGMVFLAFWAGWAYRRFRPIAALLPLGIVLAVSFSYVRQDSTFPLAVFAGIVLLLSGLQRQYLQERKWQKAHLDYAEDLRLDALISTSAISISIVTLAILIPMFSLRQIIKFFETPPANSAAETRAEVGEALGLVIPASPPGPFQRAAEGGLPRIHLLGTGPDLSERVVMSIEIDDPAPSTSPRYYWRSLTYDVYTGQGWTTSKTTSLQYREGVGTLQVSSPSRVVRQQVRLSGEAGEFIFSAGEILSVDWPFTLAWRAPPQDERFSDQFAGQVARTEYQVDVLIPAVTAAQLRAINAPLPEWVRERYLALPEGIPSRVYDFAAGVTIAQQTPFDRAVALERALRSFPYSLDLPEPPADQDVVDYFLFDLRRGYCDYYATAMVVLARASGLPARLAVGYASGTYDPINDRYVITEADAHSWVEIYFAGVGWIPFEPTGGQPEIARAESGGGQSSTVEQTPPPFERVWVRGARGVGWGIGGIILVGLVGFAGWRLWEQWRFRHLSPDEMAARLFGQLTPAGQKLAVQPLPGATPYEFATAFSRKIDQLSVPGRLFSLPQTEAQYMVRAIWRLADFFVRAAYAPDPLTDADRKEALSLWQDLRMRLWWARLRNRLIQFRRGENEFD